MIASAVPFRVPTQVSALDAHRLAHYADTHAPGGSPSIPEAASATDDDAPPPTLRGLGPAVGPSEARRALA
jgi:hypothetical protein